jgi:hypothetical protein
MSLELRSARDRIGPSPKEIAMKNRLCLGLLALTLVAALSARSLATFPKHIMPDRLEMDDRHLYICEGFVVFIYSLEDFSLIGRFGKRGEGPGEFKGKPRLHVRGTRILVNSPSKVSFYSKTGTLIREVAGIVSGRDFTPLGDRYVGHHSQVEDDGIRYSGIHLYDAEFKKIATVFRYESIAKSERGRGWHLFSKTHITPLACDGRIVVAGGSDFVIEVFDDRGVRLHTIHREYSRIPFTQAHRDKVLGLYKTRPETSREYDWWEKNIHFPEYFPAVRAVYTDDKRIYVRTYREENGRSEFFVFDSSGRQIKQTFIAIAPSQAKNAYPFMSDFSPFAIKDGAMYQLVLDEETETWNLHALPI